MKQIFDSAATIPSSPACVTAIELLNSLYESNGFIASAIKVVRGVKFHSTEFSSWLGFRPPGIVTEISIHRGLPDGARSVAVRNETPDGHGQPYYRWIPVRNADRGAEQRKNALRHGRAQPQIAPGSDRFGDGEDIEEFRQGRDRDRSALTLDDDPARIARNITGQADRFTFLGKFNRGLQQCVKRPRQQVFVSQNQVRAGCGWGQSHRTKLRELSCFLNPTV